MFIWDLSPERWLQSTFTAGFTKLSFSVSKRLFSDWSNAVRINTSFLHVPKVLEFERKLLFSALLTSHFFSGTLTCAWRILIFSSKIMCNLFWFSRSWRARQMWNPPPLTCCCWGQQQVSGGFLVIFSRINSVLSARYFLYDLLGITKNLAQKV